MSSTQPQSEQTLESCSIEMRESAGDPIESTTNPSAPPGLFTVAFKMTRAHYKRLRHYWTRDGHAGSMTDGVDLELVALGFIARCVGRGGYVTFKITPAGELELASERVREISRRSPHHDFAARLSSWLRESGRMTWENIECRVNTDELAKLCLASDIDPSSVSMFVRPDVYSMMATKTEKDMFPAVHEVKVSRADFLADMARPQKRLAYASFSEVFYFACPVGTISALELPPSVGLVIETDGGEFKIEKRAKRRRLHLDVSHMMNLVLKPGTLNPV